MFAPRTWANFISHRARRDISQYATAYYFTFCDSKTFHLYYHPIVNRKGVTHYTLQGTACEKEYEQNRSYSFCFLVGKTCFMEGAPSCLFFHFPRLTASISDIVGRSSIPSKSRLALVSAKACVTVDAWCESELSTSFPPRFTISRRIEGSG